MLSLLWTAIIGLIVGALAKLIMPGKDPGGIFITMLIGIAGAFLGFHIWGIAGGELWLNHDGQYCREPDFSSQDCALDPLLAGNVYLTTFGFAVLLIGPIPSFVLFGCIGYRRWFGKGNRGQA